MQPHQERVVTEKKELDEKIKKLAEFRLSPTCRQLPEDEQDRLYAQYTHMNNYSLVLGERIAAFK